jgi:ADP-heptose:LPS heptosyltransferase/GT2 family glycosyltransferase
MEIEQPAANAVFAAGAQVSGFGWVLAAERILSITVYVGQTRLCHATLGLARTDIADLHRGHPGSGEAGFMFSAKLPALPPDQASLRFVARTASSEFVRHVPIAIGGSKVRPVGVSGPTPLRVELEEASIDADGLLHVRGWTAGSLPTATVEVLLGANSLGFADIALSREDVAAALPAYPYAANAGFEAVMRAGRVATAQDIVTIVATDAAGASLTAARPVKLSDAVATKADSKLLPMLARLEEARVNERGILRVRGWVLSLAAVDQVRVYLDDRLLGIAEKGLAREDVARTHPDYPNATEPGFLLQQELPDEGLVDRNVRVVASGVGGIQRELTAPLVVAPVIRRRPHEAGVEFHCDSVSLSEDGALMVEGWAICPSGIATVTVSLDENEVGEAELGRDRPDVGNRFAGIPSARTAGFRLITRLEGSRWAGEHIVSLTVRGTAGEQRTVLQPVLALEVLGGEAAAPGAGGESETIKWYLDSPGVRDGRATETVRGFMSMNGWAFARAGIAGVEVFVDGNSQGEAFFGIRREDLQAAFPNWDALLSGFAMLIPPQVMTKGEHDIRVVVRDKAGHTEQVAFSIEAEAAAEGPGPWQLRHKMTQAETDLQCAILAAAAWRPEWILLLPVGRAGPDVLALARETIASLRHQAYPDWRLVVTAHSGVDFEVLAADLLAGAEDLAPQITFLAHVESQPLAALVLEDGMLAVLAPGDRVGEDCLLELSVEAAVQNRPDFLYSDDRRIDPSDGNMKAFFKPDWSPDLLLSTNYIGRAWAAVPGLLDRAGLCLGDINPENAFGVVLRMTEHAKRIIHVTKVLRAEAPLGELEVGTGLLQQEALREAVTRRGIAAEVLPGCLPGTWRLKRDIVHSGMVSIIIPSNASRGLVKITVDSIRSKTDWPSLEIILLDNIRLTDDPDKLAWKRWMREHADLVIEIDEDFNWSRFNNLGAAQARGAYLLFLNDDVEVLDSGWLHGLVEHAQRDEVGTVGPQLLYPDGRVQHAGVFLSRSVGRHAFRYYPRDEPGPFGLALTQRNVISVTGACMLVRRGVFDAVGGFDEAHTVINNDLDFSLRVQRNGWWVVYTPYVTLIHHEMVSRAKMKDVYDSDYFDASWKDLFLQGDPYFHPMLTSDYDDYLTESEPLRQFQVGHPLIANARVKRILAVKVDHIGDFIAAFPAFRRLKQHFPHAELCVLAAKASLSLAALEPAVDRVIEFNFFHARSESGRLTPSAEEYASLRDTLAPMRFDIAVDLRRQPDTRPILQESGARWLAGFDQDYALGWLDIALEFEGDVARNFKRSHVSDSLVHLVDTVATACEADRRVVQRPMPIAEARLLLAQMPAVEAIWPALSARPVVCVHTGAGAVNKQWPAASFAGLIDLLVGLEDLNVLIIGGPDEAAFADEVLGQLRRTEHVYSLVGKTGLRDLPAALLACDLYVGNDSGPKHMAAALGVPTIGIHSGSVDAGEWGPMGPFTLTMRREMTCGPCYIAFAADCPRALACLHGINVGDVYRACRRMLALRRDVAVIETAQ